MTLWREEYGCKKCKTITGKYETEGKDGENYTIKRITGIHGGTCRTCGAAILPIATNKPAPKGYIKMYTESDFEHPTTLNSLFGNLLDD